MKEKKIQLAQLPFYSLQGEGQYTGVPSVFLRFFGCNFRCPGFPCDTPYAIYPDQKDSSLLIGADEVIQKIYNCLPDTEFFSSSTLQSTHLVITGGEPLLKGTQRSILSVLEELESDMFCNYLTIETNGTQKLTTEFRDYISQLKQERLESLASISTKLESVSGEKNGWDVDILKEYVDTFDKVQFKVVADGSDECWEELERFRQDIKDAGIITRSNVSLWIMPLGNDAASQSSLTTAEISDRALAMGWNVSARVHAVIWNDDKDK